MNTKTLNFAQLFARLALGTALLSAVADRFGLYGAPGTPGVSWGDWGHFVQYSSMLTPYASPATSQVLAVIATSSEILLGICLILGLKTKLAAVGTCLLMIVFALSMTFTMGFKAPLGYSVWTSAAAAAFLSGVAVYKWSIDNAFTGSKRTA